MSAECYGQWNQRKPFIPSQYPKTDEQIQSIKEKLDMAFMFNVLAEHEKIVVINAMEEVIADPK